ncbi:alpha-ribazole phosphatase [Pectinatus haikarae]|uniref:alpha-ribazole phosphatase n=1 Tax=Pectinatus haikarae TaxID=349096 RepID=UPI002ED8C9A7
MAYIQGKITVTKIILVRHGQTEWNAQKRFYGWTDIGLSAKGGKQARLLAENFPERQVDLIYSSDLTRASDTAAYIGKQFSCEVRTDRQLREINFGKWEGLLYDEILAKWPEEMRFFLSRPDMLKIPDGETFSQVQKRAVARISEIADANAGKNIVAVTHGAFINVLLAASLRIPLRHLWSLQQENTSVNILYYREGSWQVELVNGTAHLGIDEMANTH